MKNKVIFPLLSAVILALILIFSVPTAAKSYSVDELSELIDGIFEFKFKQTNAETMQEFIDGDLTLYAGQTSEWYIYAISNLNSSYDFTSYAKKLSEYINETNIPSAVTRQKYALALLAVGEFDNDFVKSTANDSIGEFGIMSYIYGLHLLNNGFVSDSLTADSVVSHIFSLRLEDGGWALAGKSSNVDVAAMTLQSLAPYYGEKEEFDEIINNAVEYLSQKQLPSGGFDSQGIENPESTAQVIIALADLGINPLSDERFIKNGRTVVDAILDFRLDDGSFRHLIDGEYNHLATVQSLCALVSLKNLIESGSSFYVFENIDESEKSSENITENETIKDEAKPETEPKNENETESKNENEKESEAENEKIIDNDEKATSNKTKIIVTLIISGVSVAVFIVLIILKKCHIKNIIFVLILTTAAILIVWFVEILPADKYYSGEASIKENVIGSVTMTIRCDNILDKTEATHVPKDGVILPVSAFEIEDGDTVFDILVEASKIYGIQFENNGISEKLAYISGINYIYEIEFGDLSGWMYYVNGKTPSVGCGSYVLSDGDIIEWHYTCDLGNDIQ